MHPGSAEKRVSDNNNQISRAHAAVSTLMPPSCGLSQRGLGPLWSTGSSGYTELRRSQIGTVKLDWGVKVEKSDTHQVGTQTPFLSHALSFSLVWIICIRTIKLEKEELSVIASILPFPIMTNEPVLPSGSWNIFNSNLKNDSMNEAKRQSYQQQQPQRYSLFFSVFSWEMKRQQEMEGQQRTIFFLVIKWRWWSLSTQVRLQNKHISMLGQKSR